MNARYVIARLLETFFRRWWLYVIPLVALVGLGVYTAGSKADTYRSTAILSAATQTLLDDLTDTSRSDTLAFESPAQATSRKINELLRTDEFARAVAEDAGIPDDSPIVTLDDVRESIFASPEGQSLLTVNADTLDAGLAQRLAQSTIDNFRQTVIDSQVTESTATEDYFTRLQAQYEREYEQASAALLAYLRAHPEPIDGSDRSVDEQFEIERLQGVVTRADERLSATLDNIQAAQLLTEQASSEASQRLRVVDPPSFPDAPLSGLRDAAFTVGIFVALGTLLVAGAVVAASLLDRSLRFAEQVRTSLGVEVLAVVPVEVRRRSRRRRRIAA